MLQQHPYLCTLAALKCRACASLHPPISMSRVPLPPAAHRPAAGAAGRAHAVWPGTCCADAGGLAQQPSRCCWLGSALRWRWGSRCWRQVIIYSGACRRIQQHVPFAAALVAGLSCKVRWLWMACDCAIVCCTDWTPLQAVGCTHGRANRQTTAQQSQGVLLEAS